MDVEKDYPVGSQVMMDVWCIGRYCDRVTGTIVGYSQNRSGRIFGLRVETETHGTLSVELCKVIRL